MTDPIDHDESEVGYRKPPRATQFQKGKSGNPNGRPKGSKNLASMIRRDGRQLVRVNGPQGPRMISKQHAAIMQLGNKAAQGDLASMRLYYAMQRDAELAEQNDTIAPTLLPRDLSVRKNLFRRFQRINSAEPPAPTEPSQKEESE